MPIEENLQPQLPPPNYYLKVPFRTLVQTSVCILSFNPNNLAPNLVNENEEQKEDFPAFK